jgi:hypothetical protein
MQPSNLTPEQFGVFQQKEVEKWAQVVKATGVKLE